MRQRASEVKRIKTEARALLDVGSNRLWLILSIILWISSAGLAYTLSASLPYAADPSVFTDQPSTFAILMTLSAFGLMLAFALLLLAPMAGGVMLLAERIYRREEVKGSDLFEAFSSFWSYIQCLGLGLWVLAWPVLIVLPTILIGVVCTFALYTVMAGLNANIVLTLLACTVPAVLGFAGSVAVFCISRNTGVVGALMARGLPYAMARSRAKEIRRQGGLRMLGYRASFLGWLVLGIATVGVSAVIDTLPLLLLSNQFAGDVLENKENQKQDIDK